MKIKKLLLFFIFIFSYSAKALTIDEAISFEKALKERRVCSYQLFQKLTKSELKEPFLIAFAEECYEKGNYDLLSLAKEVKNPIAKLKVAKGLKRIGREREARELFLNLFSESNRFDEEILLANRGDTAYLFKPRIIRKKVWLAGARKRIDEALFYLSKLSRSDPYYTYLSAYVKMRSGQYREAKRLFLKSSVPKRYYYLIYLASSPKERLKYYKKFLSQPLSTSLKRRAAIGNLDYFFRKDLSLFKEALAATNRKELKDIYLYFRDRYRVFKRGCTRAISNAVPQKWWKSACGLSRELPRGINFYSLFLNPPKKFPYDREKVFSSLKLEDPGLAYLYYKGYCNILSLIEEKTPQTALAMNLCGEYKKGIRFALPFRGKLKEHPYLLAVLYPKPPVFGDDLVSLAIARQESLFDPLALSRSGARGLMQIMPATGRYIAKKLKERDYHTGRLYEEELNYRFGSYYIHSLLEKFGLFPLAAAAYNGGPSRVKKALELYGEIREPKDVILFNDIYIPFHETRDYVRKTSVNLYYYSNLYGSGEEWRIFLKP